MIQIYLIKYPDHLSFGKEKSPEKKQFTKQYLKQILKSYFHIDAKDEDFGKNENGKPFLKNSKLFFNLSHSQEYLIIAFGKKALGIDIEKKKSLDVHRLSRRFFHPSEQQFILSGEDPEEIFFRIWTWKESYIKWKGGSLPADLRKFNIQIKDNSLQVYENNKKIDRLFIKEYRWKDYFITICSEENHFPRDIIHIK
jgi:4'-phosphopantetheinyl transferase